MTAPPASPIALASAAGASASGTSAGAGPVGWSDTPFRFLVPGFFGAAGFFARGFFAVATGGSYRDSPAAHRGIPRRAGPVVSIGPEQPRQPHQLGTAPDPELFLRRRQVVDDRR